MHRNYLLEKHQYLDESRPTADVSYRHDVKLLDRPIPGCSNGEEDLDTAWFDRRCMSQQQLGREIIPWAALRAFC